MSDRNEDLTPVEILALSRVFDPRKGRAKAVREEIEPGEYEFDFNVHIEGVMTVREDYTSRIVAKAHPWTLLMLLADKVNEATLNSLVRQSVGIDKNDPRVKEFKERVSKAIQEIKDPTTTECKGRVQAKATVQPVGKSIIAA